MFFSRVVGQIKPDGDSVDVPERNVNYKIQEKSTQFMGILRQLLYYKLPGRLVPFAFQS